MVVREPPSAGGENEEDERADHIPYDLVKASPAHDMWAIGCILFHLCSGETLFQANDEDDISSQKNLVDLLEWSHATKQERLAKISHPLAKNLVSQLLVLDSRKRLASIGHLLAHPFFSGHIVGRLLGDPAAFDCFISYRVDTEEKLVDKLELLLRARGIKVWRDKTNLQNGVSWEIGFCDGLVKSHVFLPILSRRGIKDKFDKLTEASGCDNVLLEHRLVLELSQRGFTERIFPIFVGDVDATTGALGHYFRQGCHYTDGATMVVSSVEMKLQEHLERQGLGAAVAESRSAGSVLEGIVALQGTFVEGTELDPCLDVVADKVLEMVRDLQNFSEKDTSDVYPLPEEVLALQAALERERRERASLEQRLAEAEEARGKIERSLNEEIARLTGELALRGATENQLQAADEEEQSAGAEM